MKGIIEYSGKIVYNKREATEEAKRVLDRMLERDPRMEEPWVYVFRYDEPELIWFSVGYVKRNIANYIQLPKSAQMSSDKWERLDRFRERMRSKARQ